jgi:hypothetical protein
LSAVLSLAASGAAGGAGLRPAKILGARQLVGGIVDHFVGLQSWRSIGAQAADFTRQNDQDEE